MRRDIVLEQLVIKEAQNLRCFATQEELEKLRYETLDGDSPNRCIYGQMTGDCFSKRAGELIILCAERVYSVNDEWSGLSRSQLNGAPYELERYSSRKSEYFSPIEKFLFKYKPSLRKRSRKIKNLVDFLKGRKDTLEL